MSRIIAYIYIYYFIIFFPTGRLTNFIINMYASVLGLVFTKKIHIRMDRIENAFSFFLSMESEENEPILEQHTEGPAII